MRSFFSVGSLSTALTRHPGLTLFAALVLLTGAGLFLPRITIDNTMERMFLDHDPVRAAYDEMAERFGGDESALIAFRAPEGALSPTALPLLYDLAASLETLPYVVSVVSLVNATTMKRSEGSLVVESLLPERGSAVDVTAVEALVRSDPWYDGNLLSHDGTVTALLVRLESRPYDDRYRREFTIALRKLIGAAEARSGYEFITAGTPVFLTQFSENVVHDLSRFLPLVALVLMLVLLFTFRTLLGVFIPLMAVAFGVTATMGFMARMGYPINMVTTILPPLLTVIGVTNVIHILSAYHEQAEKHSELSRDQQMKAALMLILGPCFMSSATTAVGFGSLLLSDVQTIRQTGIVACFGVLATFIGATMLAPPLALTVPERWIVNRRLHAPSGALNRYLQATTSLILKFPRTLFWGATVVALVVTAGMFRLTVETNLVAYFSENSEVAIGHRFMQRYLSGAAPIELLIKAETNEQLLSGDGIEFLAALESRLRQEPLFPKVMGPATLLQRAEGALSDLPVTAAVVSRELAHNKQMLLFYELGDPDLVRSMIDDNATHITIRGRSVSSRAIERATSSVSAWTSDRIPAGLQVSWADSTNRMVFLVDTLVPSQMRSLAVAMLLISLMLVFFMRDIGLGFAAMLPNVIPILMTLGFMGLVGIELNLSTATIPSIAIGLAVDDTIHIFNRFARERKIGDVDQAIRETLMQTGRPVLFTSVVLFAGFIVMVASNFVPNVYFGIMTAFTTLTALLADLYMGPAMLLLLYRRKRG